MRSSLRGAAFGLFAALSGAVLGAIPVPAGAVAPATSFEGGPGARPSLEQFFKIRAPGVPAMLPDGSLLVRDWPDGIWQLYRITPKNGSYRPGEAASTKLTTFPDGLASFSVSPDGAKVILMHAVGGNENTQLTLLDLAKPGELKPILANGKVQASVNCWLADSSGFLYSANDVSPSDFHLYHYDFGAGKAAKILAREGSWSAHDITKDRSRVLVEQFLSASNTACFELDVKSGQLTDITIRTADETASCGVVGYMPSEDAVLMTTDFDGGRVALHEFDLKAKKVRRPVPSLNKFEVDAASFNDTKDLLVVSANEDGYGAPHVFSIPSFKELPAPKADRGVATVGSFRGRTMVWANNNARDPGAAFASTWGADGGAPETKQVAWVDTQGLDLSAFPLPELVKYKAFDGVEIPSFLFLPPGYKKGTPIPFVLLYHGGPEGQHRPTFSATQQYLLSEGFGVMLPNVRGSTGYGRSFQMMDDYKKRWDSVKDGVDAAEWLVANGYSTPGKMTTFGGSYGGFMSVACLVEDQERVDAGKRKERLFGAGIDIVGIVNLKTFLERTAGYRRKLREAEYGPLSDPEFLLSVSSMQRLDKLKVPMFIAHGFNDPRVPVEEAMQLSVALKDKGVPVQLFIAPDEGHGFQKLQNRLYFYERAAAFLKETIGK